ncbi:ribonucleoside diphosphate reductase small subunit [Acinetobacter phage EAb13]|nr:ribonucleoside diphosphate reductase small subunit [Acinetobacter phage EAb13]
MKHKENNVENQEVSTFKLTDKRPYYKPFTYPWAYQYAEEHRRMNWTKEEVRSLHEDIMDWHSLSEERRKPLELLLLYFTQADWDIGDSYVENLFRWYKMPELRMGLIRTVDREATHVDNYDLLPDQFGIPHRNYKALMDIDAIYDQHEFMVAKTEGDTVEDRLMILTKHICGEGISIYGIFLMLLNESRFGRMKCLGQEIVSWSARDENQHVAFLTKIFRTELEENPEVDLEHVRQVVIALIRLAVERAIAMAKTVLSYGPLEDLDLDQIAYFLMQLANVRVKRMGLGIESIYDVDAIVRLDWAGALFRGSLDNFFETAGTNYQIGALVGDWEYPEAGTYFKDTDYEKMLMNG